jgi:A/G-specific adenine glycosylase
MTVNPIVFFQTQLLEWYQNHGRHDLPWQNKTAYEVWLSEIMLQQTQVSTVIPYFLRFIEQFPTLESLAGADQDTVFKLWAGLGYYHRAKNLLKTAQIIQQQYSGQFPCDLQSLKALPGIGPSTAAAIASQAFGLPHAIFDGNVKRVLARFFGIEGSINDKTVLKTLEELAQQTMPEKNCQAYTQAIMDMGATCCKIKNPQCATCPLQNNCIAYQVQKTTIIPGKAKSISKPVKRYDFAIYIKQKQILLEKRPNTGIWPNLWCFPNFEHHQNQDGAIKTRHTLTHQHMQIHIHIQKDCPAQGQWFSLEHLQDLALPKVFQKLLPNIEQLLND